MPSIAPSHAGPAPIAAKNAGSTAVAVSWLQSEKSEVRPTPSTVRFSHAACFCGSTVSMKFRSKPELNFAAAGSAFCCLPLLAGTAPSFLLCRGAIQNHAHFFESDQSAFHHFIQPWKNLLDVLSGVDH